MKKNKKIILLLIFAIVLVGVSIGGTVAWLTAKTSKTNTFTVGSFAKPTTSPNGDDTVTVDDYLVEPSWDANVEHKLVPSAEFDKDPYVGIGEGSEEAVVYVYVDNEISSDVYFTINTGWEAVEGKVTAGSKAGTYTKGLFKYSTNLVATDADVWTTNPLFSKVEVASTATAFDADSTGNYNVTVSAFIHQAKDSEGTEIDADTIKTAAITALIG